MWCPRCGSLRVVKSGHARGKQRWLCRKCGYQFTRTPDAGVPETTKRAAVTLYGHGLSLRCVGKLLGTTAQSVLRWVCGTWTGTARSRRRSRSLWPVRLSGTVYCHKHPCGT
jgi:transposase-like protein